jgi:hypothetical protein
MNKNLIYLLLVVFLAACKPIAVDSVKAKPESPLWSGNEDVVNIPYRSDAKRVALVVEPVMVKSPEKKTSIDGSVSLPSETGLPAFIGASVIKKDIRIALENRQSQITRQLTSALAGVKNFKLLDYEIYQKRGGITPSNIDAGPYLVRAVITECNREIVNNKSTLAIPAVFKAKKQMVKGAVGLDVSVVNPSTGEVLESFPVHGTHISKSNKGSFGVIAPFASSSSKAKSALDQALRAALNDAAKQLSNKLAL